MNRSICEWHIRDRLLSIGDNTLVMGILNITPDSFSDGSQYFSVEKAIEHGEQMIAEGADIIDIGGESTRPGATLVSQDEEIQRVIPVVEGLAKRIAAPISVDTTKSAVAAAALAAGASIINDVSALRFDFHIADEVARARAGLVLMHSRGTAATMHRLPAVPDIIREVSGGLKSSVTMAERRGVKHNSIVIDPGIGFGKTLDQNIELIAKIEQVALAFPDLPILIGTSRKSFIGRLLNDAPPADRLHGTMATITAAVLHGVHIVRVHDVKAAVETVRIADAIRTSLATS
jgi:dihydropteroate synthase